jgi:hypothetical protein
MVGMTAHFIYKNMAFNNFTKYIPVAEEDYHAFKEQQRKEIKRVGEDLVQPAALQPLADAQKEKTRVLFDPNLDPNLQEQRFAHLTSIISDLRRKLEDQPAQPVAPPAKVVAPLNLGKREGALFSALGPDIWSDDGELLIDGNVIPNSDKTELLNYAATNWSSKYSQNVPAGGKEMLDLLRQKKIPQKLWSIKLRSAASTPPIQGLASVVTAQKKRKAKPSGALKTGFDVLASGSQFKKFMNIKKTRALP